jgi:hypothetical protein
MAFVGSIRGWQHKFRVLVIEPKEPTFSSIGYDSIDNSVKGISGKVSAFSGLNIEPLLTYLLEKNPLYISENCLVIIVRLTDKTLTQVYGDCSPPIPSLETLLSYPEESKIAVEGDVIAEIVGINCKTLKPEEFSVALELRSFKQRRAQYTLLTGRMPVSDVTEFHDGIPHKIERRWTIDTTEIVKWLVRNEYIVSSQDKTFIIIMIGDTELKYTVGAKEGEDELDEVEILRKLTTLEVSNLLEVRRGKIG